MTTIELFHGSFRRFSAFSKDVSPRFDTGQNILGHYFTQDPDLALAYARGRWGKVYVVEASFENMKVVPLRHAGGLSEIERMQLDFREEDFQDYRDNLIADGYDSVCFEIDDGSCEYVFLHDEQIEIRACLTASDFKADRQYSTRAAALTAPEFP